MDVEGPFLGKSDVCEPIPGSLPEWFAIERAVVQYIEDIEKTPMRGQVSIVEVS